MQFKKVDHHIYDALLNADRKRGITLGEIVRRFDLAAIPALKRLLLAEYIEGRLEGESWPDGGQADDSSFNRWLRITPRSARSLFRTTTPAKRTLAARIQSDRT